MKLKNTKCKKNILKRKQCELYSQQNCPGVGNGNPFQLSCSSNPLHPIPWTEESGGLQSMGLQRVGHDCMIKPSPPTARLQNRRPLTFPLPINTLSKQLHIYQLPLREIQKIVERYLHVGQLRKCPPQKSQEKLKHTLIINSILSLIQVRGISQLLLEDKRFCHISSTPTFLAVIKGTVYQLVYVWQLMEPSVCQTFEAIKNKKVVLK